VDGSRTVGEVAAMAGVTVRTLHHYDRIGLLSPSGRSASGYRLYAPADLDRLHQVLMYRELGFSLEDVAALLADDADPEAHLRRQHQLLRDRLERTQQMVAAVEKEMEARAMGMSLTPEEKFEVFGEFDPDQYEQEVQERWGETDAYAQSKSRTSSYTKEDWVRIKQEGEDVEARFAAALRAGVPADSEQAMDVAEAHRQQISRNFYDCPPAMHAGLGRMYVEDERFAAHYERRAPGLAQYVSEAVQANAARQGA
jgi:MerR family transcriptional regulator, thiopeptide resistance regulator